MHGSRLDDRFDDSSMDALTAGPTPLSRRARRTRRTSHAAARRAPRRSASGREAGRGRWSTWLAAVALLPAVLVPLAIGADAQDAGGDPPPLPAVVLAEVMSDPETGGREFVELLNRGNVSVDLLGWKLRDATGNTFTFPAWTLAPLGRVAVWGGGAATAEGPAWSMASAWNNAGDTAILLRADGSEADRFQYGTADRPAPAKGEAWVLRDTWAKGVPTPGRHPDAVGGTMSVTVANVAPGAAFIDPPGAAKPGATVALTVRVTDPNGAADVAAWRIEDAAGVVLAQGATGGDHTSSLTAPSARGPWLLRLVTADQAGAEAAAEHRVTVQESALLVSMPDGGAVPFPSLPPGGRALATAPVVLENSGPTPLRVLLDVSDLRGPAAFPAAGHIVVHLTGDVAAELPYASAMQELPPLAAGARVELTFEIVDLPVPLPSGSYGTSFALVAI